MVKVLLVTIAFEDGVVVQEEPALVGLLILRRWVSVVGCRHDLAVEVHDRHSMLTVRSVEDVWDTVTPYEYSI